MRDRDGVQGFDSAGSPDDASAHVTERIPVGAVTPGADGVTERIYLGGSDQGAVDQTASEETQIIDLNQATDPAGPPDPPAPGGNAGAGDSTGPRWPLIAAIASGAVLLVLAVVYLVDLLGSDGQIERRTTIAGVEVDGMTPAEATTALTAQAVPDYQQPMTIDVHGEPVTLDPAAAGLTPDVAASVAAAGTRSANPFVRLTSFFTSTELPLAVQVDEAALSGYLGEVAKQTDLQPVEGEVSISGTTVNSVDPVIGRSLQVPEAVDLVSATWASAGPSSLDGLALPVTSSPVRANPEKTQAAAAEATAILAAPLVLTGTDAAVEIPVESIAAAVSVTPDSADGFTVAVDVPGLRTPYTPAVEETQNPPVDATISIVDDKPVVNPAVPGRTVDWPATDAAIEPALRGPHTAAVVYSTTEPGLTTEQAQALGIKEVIGEFTTGGFAAASGENIRVVAEKVNGAIVQPGATFGLNEFTGPRGTDQGYVPAAIIQEGALSTAVGGGISQFATTLYNASYFAGMGDVTHTPHSFYISRYPPGREATVFDGEIELAFANDYPTGVLIQTIWTDEDITVRLWGTKHVQVESETTDRFNYTSPQVVVKPYGTSCSPSGGSSGFSVVNTRIIKDLSGQELRREDFTTVYNGQQNVICSPPPAAATPAPADAAEAPVPDPAAAGG